jgi:DNA-binding transcriptional regulator YhcF (GntR family)
MRRRDFLSMVGGATIWPFPSIAQQPVKPAATPTKAAAFETPKPAPAAKFLGAAMSSPNYTVGPAARSDGMMRIFRVDSAYGQYEFDGVEFTKLRLREIDAIATLEKMSKSEEWAKSFGNAAMTPLKFGASFLVNPAEALNRSASGISNMFDRVSAGMSNQKSSRDSLTDSLLGVSDSQRQLAIQLNVDPYTDFAPLQNRLQEMARVMTGGQLTVRAGLVAVTGGIGMGISAAMSLESAKDTLRDKTAAQVIVEVLTTLKSLGVPEETINRLVENQNFTPAFLLVMSRALAQLNAQNTAAYIERAADANSYGMAYFHWRRADLIAARSAELGGLVAFVPVSGHVINVTRDGRVVAVVPMDDLAWTDLPKRTFLAANAELRRLNPNGAAVFATTGLVTPLASAEIKKLGWQIVQLKPTR